MSKIIIYYLKDDKLKLVETSSGILDLYYLKARLPTKEDVPKIKDTKINKYFKDNGFDKGIEGIRNTISKDPERMPLYDTYSNNIYMIDKNNVYNRVTNHHYRVPDEILIEEFEKEKITLEKKANSMSHSSQDTKTVLLIRRHRKLELMLDFIKDYNIAILSETYIKVFYYYSNEVGKDITTCKRPSFMPHFYHITPYYTRSELINMSLNMELIKPNSEFYDVKRIEKLCKTITKNDIVSDTLLSHQKYIVKNNKVGIIQYYSLQGSYFMNQYLRGHTPYKRRNRYLEGLITNMWEVVNSSPEFDQSYTLYRFIENDSHIDHLKIGDQYTEPSFVSTTRDPFYNNNIFRFGFILIKIKIPGHTPGVGLCIETISHFPNEQEIIMSPLSILKLDKRDDNCIYYHTDDNFAVKVKTRYEFTYVGKKKIEMPDLPSNLTNTTIDFLHIDKIDSLSVHEKISHFVRKYISELYQFDVEIDKKNYTVVVEWYDSTAVYKDFYASQEKNGFSMYNITDNYTTFMIEIGEDINGPFMYANYYFRYSIANKKPEFTQEAFIKFISSIAHYFGIPVVIIYSNYASCDLMNINREQFYGGNYSVDIYNYLKNKKKRFNIDSMVLKAGFNYYHFDRLRKTSPSAILNKSDRDELFQMYSKVYRGSNDDNLSDFYVWVVENHCYLAKTLVLKMYRMYHQDNPFEKDYYILEPSGYLYNNGFIETYQNMDLIEKDTFIPKNDYRSINQRNPRVPSTRTFS